MGHSSSSRTFVPRETLKLRLKHSVSRMFVPSHYQLSALDLNRVKRLMRYVACHTFCVWVASIHLATHLLIKYACATFQSAQEVRPYRPSTVLEISSINHTETWLDAM